MIRIAASLLIACVILLAPAAADEDVHQDREPNRLARETSPYLLQHAYNPVDWYAWGPEAFEAARAQDKPIFLSIGYSTCYWCHVMERESFENEAIAAQMNENFICIKLDREERPDVDEIYMTAVTSMRGRGGWPLSAFLDPHTLRAFRGGTYFPAKPGRGRMTFPALLTEVTQAWNEDRQTQLANAERVARIVTQRLEASRAPVAVGRADVDNAVNRVMAGYDAQHGGFRRGAPKFPVPVTLELLMAAGWDRPDVQRALLRTLDAMAMGGIYDQVGGGFHRYSTDALWRVPHFEKMLYDNAQLASIYAGAFERTRDPFYARITRETLDYVLREMTGPEGAFYSAQDAEVNAREGGSYVWTRAEVTQVLTDAGLADDVDFAIEVFGLAETNFQDPHHPGDGRKNVLYRTKRPNTQAADFRLNEAGFEQRLAGVRAALLAARDLREQPGTDDKIITAWNALMITAFVDGARALEEPRYLAAAERAGAFMLDEMHQAGRGLTRTYRAGEARIDAFLVDYALLIRAMLALDAASDDPRWRRAAMGLATEVRAGFREEDGGYFNTRDSQPDLFVRSRQLRDSVMPCGNSVMLGNGLDLLEASGDDAVFAQETAEALEALSAAIKRNSSSVPTAVFNLHRVLETRPGLVGVETGPGAVADANNPVVISASTDAVHIKPREPGNVDVTIDIADGFHINASEPGLPNLIGLEIRVSGGSGVAITPTYPEGELYRDEIRIHRGRVTVPVEVRYEGALRGEPRLMVVYQVCTDKACLPSSGRVLPVRILSKPNRPNKIRGNRR